MVAKSFILITFESVKSHDKSNDLITTHTKKKNKIKQYLRTFQLNLAAEGKKKQSPVTL